MAPQITVIMPVWNCKPYLAEAIESILTQTFGDFELLAIDDTSSDGSRELLEYFAQYDSRILVLTNSLEKGIVGAINTGINAAQGEFIARMDGDDISMPHRFERQVSFLRKHPEIGICGTYGQIFSVFHEGLGHQIYPTKNNELMCQLLFSSSFSHPTVMWRRTLFEDYHLKYDQSFCFSEDYELWTRVSGKVAMANIPELLLRYRTHSNNIGIRHYSEQRNLAKLIITREIAKLGISPTPEEIELHQEFTPYPSNNFIISRMHYKKLRFWFRKLQSMNNARKIYDESSLSRLLNYKEYEFISKLASSLLKEDNLNFKDFPLVFRLCWLRMLVTSRNTSVPLYFEK